MNLEKVHLEVAELDVLIAQIKNNEMDPVAIRTLARQYVRNQDDMDRVRLAGQTLIKFVALCLLEMRRDSLILKYGLSEHKRHKGYDSELKDPDDVKKPYTMFRKDKGSTRNPYNYKDGTNKKSRKKVK